MNYEIKERNEKYEGVPRLLVHPVPFQSESGF